MQVLPQLEAVLIWYGALFALGAVTFPWLGLLFRRLPDRGYGASRVAGLVTMAYVGWWYANHGGRFDRTAILVALSLTGAASLLLLVTNGKVRRELWRVVKRRAWRVELAILAVFVFAGVLRAFQPEIYWGEKPMDFTFFNYFGQLETLPAEDPWASDRPIRYYYMGNWMFGVLQKLTGVAPGVGYNLALVSLVTLAFGALLSALYPLVRRFRWAALGALLPMFLANTEAVIFLVEGRFPRINFDFFWATSRMLKHSVANEYPLWSYLFGDLHAHVMGLPGAALFLALFVGLLAQKKRPPTWRGLAMRLTTGAAWGAMFAINGWDAIAYGLVVPVALALKAPARLLQGAPRTGLGRRVLDFGVVGFAAFLVAYPFWESILPISGSMGHGWTTNDFHDLASLWRFGAILWLPLFGIALARALRGPKGNARSQTFGYQNFAATEPRRLPLQWDEWMQWAPIGLLLVFAFLPRYVTRPWATLFTGGVILALGWALRYGHGQSGNRRIAGALLGGGGVLFLFTECYWLVERMNSLFKLHYAFWFLCAFVLAASLPAVVNLLGMARREWADRRSPLARRAVLLTAAALIVVPALAGLVGTTTAIAIMTTDGRMVGPRPTLDGTAYLSTAMPEEQPVIDYLRTHAEPQSVVLEAHGDPYREFTRIAMHTGLPTVLGWEHHVKQRGTPVQEVEARKRDIERIYTTQDEAERLRLLDKYGVRYVVLTKVERNLFGPDRLTPWSHFSTTTPDRIRVVFDRPEARVFAVAPPEAPKRTLARE